MSVEQLDLDRNDDVIGLVHYDDFNLFVLTINGQSTYLDRSQAHLLMLYLQEHLK